MSEVFAGVNGHGLVALRLVVGNIGPWVAECDFEGAPELTGAVTITVGQLELHGTVDAQASGVEAGQFRARIVAGGGGWSTELTAKHYHNDARVKAKLVAEDAAREVGERIGTFVPTAERVGADYVRSVGPASRALEDVLGGAPWWVDYEGATNVGPRPAVPVDASAYEVLAYDPRSRMVTLAVPDPRSVTIGSVLSQRLDAPQTVRELELTVQAGDLRIVAWCGGSESGAGLLPELLRSIVERASDGRLWGPWRYRVVSQAGDRLNLQAVRKAAGLPDVLPVSMWPGIAGAHSEPTPGSEVLVEFVEGDRTMPVVTHFVGKDGQGFQPVRLTIGGPSGTEAARMGDTVEVLLPPAVFSGTVGGSPATGVLTFTLNKTLGTITSGSSKVRIAT